MTIEVREAAQGYALQPDEGERIDELRLRIVATEALTGGTMMAVECVNPGPGGPPLHTHHSHDEAYYVLEGRYRFNLAGTEHEGGPGTFVYAPRGTTHTFASVGPGEGRLLALSLPCLEAFLRRMAALSLNGNRPEDLERLFRDFDSEVNGPPLV